MSEKFFGPKLGTLVLAATLLAVAGGLTSCASAATPTSEGQPAMATVGVATSTVVPPTETPTSLPLKPTPDILKVADFASSLDKIIFPLQISYNANGDVMPGHGDPKYKDVIKRAMMEGYMLTQGWDNCKLPTAESPIPLIMYQDDALEQFFNGDLDYADLYGGFTKGKIKNYPNSRFTEVLQWLMPSFGYDWENMQETSPIFVRIYPEKGEGEDLMHIARVFAHEGVAHAMCLNHKQATHDTKYDFIDEYGNRVGDVSYGVDNDVLFTLNVGINYEFDGNPYMVEAGSKPSNLLEEAAAAVLDKKIGSLMEGRKELTMKDFDADWGYFQLVKYILEDINANGYRVDDREFVLDDLVEYFTHPMSDGGVKAFFQKFENLDPANPNYARFQQQVLGDVLEVQAQMDWMKAQSQKK
jgi:hypothetical protein